MQFGTIALIVLVFAFLGRLGLFLLSSRDTTFVTKGGEVWKDSGTLQQSCTPRLVHQPKTVDELVRIVTQAAAATELIRVVGAGHSMNDIALSNDHLVNLDLMNTVLAVDEKTMTAEVEAGIRVKDEQSIAGAFLTGTHGDGIGFTSIAGAVVGVEIVLGTGQVRRLAESNPEEKELLNAVRVRMQRSKLLHAQDFNKPWGFVEDNFYAILEKNEHARFYYFPRTKTEAPAKLWTPAPFLMNFFSLILSGSSYFPDYWAVPYFNFLIALMQDETRVGQSYHIQASGAPRRNGFFVSYNQGLEAVKTLVRCFETNSHVRTNVPVVIRNAAQDDGSDMEKLLILEADSLVVDNPSAFNETLAQVEQCLDTFQARPHWGKLHNMGYKELTALYPKLEDFRKLRFQWDPKGVFVNSYVKRVLQP